MPADLPTLSLLLSVLLVALPLLGLLWRQQRRLDALRLLQSHQRELLQQAQQRVQTLDAQVQEAAQHKEQWQQLHARQQAQLAALQRERELRPAQQQQARADAQAWQAERQQQVSELRRLDAQRSALAAELREQQEHQQQRLNDLQGARDSLRAQFAELAGQIFEEREQRFAEHSQQRLGQLLEPLKERIQAFEKRVEESYQQEARERFSLGHELQRLQQLNQRLGDEATRLSRALQGQKQQGNWGELVLERVLEHAGLHKGREYETQVSLKGADGQRLQPDVLIRLPGERQIIVDAKVSLQAYQQAVAAPDETARQAALRQHVQSLRGHLKNLASKDYSRLEGLHSLDFVLLFVPLEAAFAAALEQDGGLFQEAFEQRIVIVSPTTLLATLRVIDSLWRQERQGQNAREIAERAGWLYDKFTLFVADLDEIGTRLQQLDKAYAGARNKLVDGRGNLVRRAEQLRELGARTSKQLPAELLSEAGESLRLDDPRG